MAYLAYRANSSTPAKIPINGELGGQKINTTVDSEIAQYFLENYLQNNKTNPELDSIIKQTLRPPGNIPASREYYEKLSLKFSVDFSALCLAKNLLDDHSNNIVYNAFCNQPADQKTNAVRGTSNPPSKSSSYVFLLVPGWIYKAEPESGADLSIPQTVINQLGYESYTLETDENGTIEQNAIFIVNEITRYSNYHKKIVLMSASKGGAEVAHTLGNLMDPQNTRNVKAWINIGGILQGSMLADSILKWPKRWLLRPLFLFNGWNIASIESMSTQKSTDRFRRLKIPKHILTINYIGIPLSGSISERARRGYTALRSGGPNDGLTLITDALAPDGITIFEIGLDHFFLDPEIDSKTANICSAVVNFLESRQKEFL